MKMRENVANQVNCDEVITIMYTVSYSHIMWEITSRLTLGNKNPEVN